ncbi:MAG: NADP-specific glutamate dehydrogenase [Pseudomonadota bacterium]
MSTVKNIAKSTFPFQDYLKQYHPYAPEFYQAVTEVYTDVMEFYLDNPRYAEENVLERLMEPDRILRFRVTWEDDNGHVQVNRGYRVQFNNVLGAYKGGLRFHPSVNESIFKFLGFEQCFKNALTGLPMGGGKGGSDFNPKGRSDREVMRFCHAFMKELYRYIGPDIDVPAGDINVGAREIGYLYGQYLQITNRWEGVLTGKSPGFGGSCGRTEATGHGVVYFLQDMLEAHDRDLSGQKVIISGAGNVALHAAEKCMMENAQVLTISDSSGTLYFKKGMNPNQLQAIKTHKLTQRQPLKAFTEGDFYPDKSPWAVEEATVAVPCATQNEMDAEHAKIIVKNKVTTIVEGANMPLTDAAQNIVLQNPIIYGPGKSANAGGVAVSGLERSQNKTLVSWSIEFVDEKLRQIMRDIHKRSIQHVAKENGIYPYRKGANIYSFKRLADTLLAYGLK